jgi:hypothetical protein
VTRALAAALATGFLAAVSANAATISIGRGLPPWTLGQRYVEQVGLVHYDLYPRNSVIGCVAGPASASRIDYYRGRRVAWRPGPGKRLLLFDVATSRAGDHSSDGSGVGVSRLGAVRARHAGTAVATGRGPLSLGARSLTLTRRTSKETFAALVYWFDARGVLTALETYAAGC